MTAEIRNISNDFTILYAETEGLQISALCQNFVIYAAENRATIRAMNSTGQTYSFQVTVKPDEILPDVPGMTLLEKLTLRFDLARRGETRYADFRFCFGPESSRKAAYDNLQPGYGR